MVYNYNKDMCPRKLPIFTLPSVLFPVSGMLKNRCFFSLVCLASSLNSSYPRSMPWPFFTICNTQIRLFFLQWIIPPVCSASYQIYNLAIAIEEVSMKWMDRPSVTEKERGGVYEMDIAHLLYPFLWHLVCPSLSYGPKLFKKKIE